MFQRFNEKMLIGTNGRFTDELMVGPQPLPPGIPNAERIKTMSLPSNANTNLTERINLGADYYEQYWYNKGTTPVYSLMISPRYTTTTKAMVSFTNNGATYENQVLFIPLNEKPLYAPLWDKTVNSKYTFEPTVVTNRNKISTTGFTATPN
jgi:hypothetical protein